MSTPKRHHYLPQFYLEKFSRGGLLWVYDRVRNEFRRQPVKDTAVETHRYSFVDENGRVDTSMETVLSRFEALAAPAIAKLEAGEGPTKDEMIAVAAFAAQLNTRVPDSDKTIRNVNEYLRTRFRDLLDETPPSAGKEAAISVELPHAGKTLSREQIADFLKRLGEGGFEKKRHLREMLTIARGLTLVFANLDWIVCHPPRGRAFVTTDSPLVTSAPPGWKPGTQILFGAETPGTTKLIPLSPTAGLFMFDKGGRFAHRAIYEPQLRQSNIALTSACDRFVIGRDEAHLRSLVRAAHLASRGEKARFIHDQ